MRLRFLPVNQAYAFFFGDTMLRLHDSPMFFQYRMDAVEAANYCGLSVLPSGIVTSK